MHIFSRPSSRQPSTFALRGVTCVCLMALMTALGACSTSPDARPMTRSISGGEIQSGDGTDLNAGLRLAEASRKGGDSDTAVEMYRKLLRRFPNDPQVLQGLGDSLMDANALEEARVAYQQLLGQQANSTEAVIGLGRVALRQHDGKEAERQFSAALIRTPTNRVARNGLAVAYDLQDRHTEAEDIYRALLTERPDDMAARNNLGLCLALQGREKDAIALFLQVSDSPSAPAQLRHNLALAYGLNGNGDLAEEIDRMDLPPTAVMGNRAFYDQARTAISVQ